jgi:hypothetical protein
MSENILKTYIDLGWVVIPTHGKKPAIKWGRYKNDRPTMDEYRLWFNGGKSNVAVITGELSGICIIDFDSADAITNHPELYGIETYTVRSRRGVHKYFKYPQGKSLITVKNHPDYSKIDFLMNGSLATIPPSSHSEGHYVGESGDINNLADLPDNIIELCTNNERKHVFSKRKYTFMYPRYGSVSEIPIKALIESEGLKGRGNAYYCYSGHDKDSPSLMVYEPTNTYYCFGCGRGGSPMTLLKDMHGLSSAEAVNYAEERHYI